MTFDPTPAAGEPSPGSVPPPAAYPPPPPAGAAFPPPAPSSAFPPPAPSAPAYPPPPAPSGAYPPPAAPIPPAAPFPPAPTAGNPLSGFDPKSVNTQDWAILALGFLTLIFSFFGFYAFKIKVSGTAAALLPGASDSQHYSAWHDIFGGGFFAWIGIIAAVVGTATLATSLFTPQQARLPIAPRLAVLGGFAIALVCELLALVVHPKFASAHGPGISASFGHGFSYYIVLILVAAGTVLSFLRLRATGGRLPWEPGGNPLAGPTGN